MQIRDPDGRVDVLGDFDPDVVWNGPLTVLVNRLSASASEIFAGAIQDYERGLIVGSRTFGKGTVQVVQPIDHGQLKLTHSKFYRISGDSTQNKGVIPDIQLPTLYDEEEIGESALEAALPWDQVRPVRYGRFPLLDQLLPELKALHQQRVSDDPDFRFMREQIAHLQERKQSNQVPLNEARRKAEREEAENWLLQLENERRQAKGLEPLDNIAAIDETLPKDEEGHSLDPEAEALLHESGAITLDMIRLAKNQATAQSASTP